MDISNLGLEGGIYVRDLALPEGVTAEPDPDTLIVHVVVRGRPGRDHRGGRRNDVTQPEVIKPERKEKEKE